MVSSIQAIAEQLNQPTEASAAVAENEPKLESDKELDAPATENEKTSVSGNDETSTDPEEGVQDGQPKLPIIGDYALLGRIGAGGMGRVFRAELRGPAGFRKQVAIKVVKSEVLSLLEGHDLLRTNRE